MAVFGSFLLTADNFVSSTKNHPKERGWCNLSPSQKRLTNASYNTTILVIIIEAIAII
jgi:hypothetical protein